MLNALYKEQNIAYTENGAKAVRSTGSACLDFFSAVGALRGADAQRILDLFTRAHAENADLTLRTLFYARDVRGGLGERRVFRIIIEFLARFYPESLIKNLTNIPKYGRYDDLLPLLGTPCERPLAEMIKRQLADDLTAMRDGTAVSLLAKWMPSVNTSNTAARSNAKQLAKLLGMKEKEYRQTLCALRRYIDVLERRLCAGDYRFDYEKLPSRALYKYREAFARNDSQRYTDFLNRVAHGEAVLKTGGLYPYEIVAQCLRPQNAQERRILDATWRSLPGFPDCRNAIAVVDGSGSMYTSLDRAGHTAISVALSLGMYFAQHNTGAFHNRFITFSTTPQLVEIKGEDIYEQTQYCASYNEISNTDLFRVFMLLLTTAVKHGLPQAELPETVYIISDMEFDVGVSPDETVFESAKRAFEKYGYRLPGLVYWNVASRNRQYPVEQNENDVALVSGCSQSVFRMAMGQNTTPTGYMLQVLNSERYKQIFA